MTGVVGALGFESCISSESDSTFCDINLFRFFGNLWLFGRSKAKTSFV